MLEGKRLPPTKVGILAIVVYKSEERVTKIMKDTLEECLQCTIQWQRHLVRGTSSFAANNAIEAVKVFEFTEDVEDIYTSLQQPLNWSTGIEGPSSCRSVVDSNSVPIPSFQCPFSNILLQSQAQRSLHS